MRGQFRALSSTFGHFPTSLESAPKLPSGHPVREGQFRALSGDFRKVLETVPKRHLQKCSLFPLEEKWSLLEGQFGVTFEHFSRLGIDLGKCSGKCSKPTSGQGVRIGSIPGSLGDPVWSSKPRFGALFTVSAVYSGKVKFCEKSCFGVDFPNVIRPQNTKSAVSGLLAKVLKCWFDRFGRPNRVQTGYPGIAGLEHFSSSETVFRSTPKPVPKVVPNWHLDRVPKVLLFPLEEKCSLLEGVQGCQFEHFRALSGKSRKVLRKCSPDTLSGRVQFEHFPDTFGKCPESAQTGTSKSAHFFL